jgi:hypothetical protein|tara:strand:+ start:183 stop:383 length:201 start_codon:yes stop_codon:yes gene_type:complete
MTNVIKRDITVAKHKFRIEIYPQLDSSNDVTFEIYPGDYNAALYAFSNKEKLNRLIKEKHIYEPKK